MLGFEFAAGPAVSLLELHSEQVIRPIVLAVFYAGLTAVSARKFEGDKGVRRHRDLAFQACA